MNEQNNCHPWSNGQTTHISNIHFSFIQVRFPNELFSCPMNLRLPLWNILKDIDPILLADSLPNGFATPPCSGGRPLRNERRSMFTS